MKIEIDRPRYEPGDSIGGTVQAEPGRVRVSLCWETVGKGDRDSAEVAMTFVDIGESRSARFTIDAPQSPISFSGKLISLVYYVTIGAKQEARASLVIAPGGVEARTELDSTNAGFYGERAPIAYTKEEE